MSTVIVSPTAKPGYVPEIATTAEIAEIDAFDNEDSAIFSDEDESKV